ncbi:head decoration protein [bacterium]|nr:head decoration protein [bacterium]
MSDEIYTPDKLIAGDHPVPGQDVTIISGQTLTRGALLGKITASGKCTLCDSTAEDGSEDPHGVLAEDVDASGGDVDNVPYYLAGEFNEAAMTYGGTDDADTHRAALRILSIYLTETVAA